MTRSRFSQLGLLPSMFALGAACGGGGGIASPAVEVEALTVASVVPANGAQHVDPAGAVVITFSKAVQPGTVTPSSVSVGTAQGTLAVSGATVTFTPTDPLGLGLDYQVRLSGVRATDGGSMAAAYTSSFTTRSAPICIDCPATAFARADVEPSGTVVQTPEGFTVEGSLSLKTGENTKITFVDANLDVRFENGRLKSISGKVQIPSPHERITFADPVRADIGIFTGSFLNEHRDLGILLKDDTDYFVFDFETQLSMSIATGETGGGATKPVVVRNPVGGRTLMVVDYRDPMYYVYGEQDAIGAAGTGWSLNDRIPFVPKLPVDGLGSFDGGSTRTGTFPFKKVFSITGQIVDNATTELHLSQEDPFSSNLGAGYQAGFNGSLALDMFLKDIVGFEIPLAEASGGIKATASTDAGFSGYAFARGMTSRDFSWWPAFVPARPVRELEVQSRVETNGNFKVFLAGSYGWQLPAGPQTMNGSFELTNEAMTLTGSLTSGDVDLNVTGVVTAPQTEVSVEPPQELLSAINNTVNDQVLTQIAAAQKAYADLQAATKNYEFELSLRGVRNLLPGIVDVALAQIDTGITIALKPAEGLFFYNDIRGLVEKGAKPYVDQLKALKTAAQSGDGPATRIALENALRTVADNKIAEFSVTFVITVTFRRRILSDTDANKLIVAANNVKYIKETSDIKVSMQNIYNLIPDRLIFEQVRDDLVNGVLVMKPIEKLGVVIPHGTPLIFKLFTIIGGTRYEAGSIEALDVATMAARLPEIMIKALRAN